MRSSRLEELVIPADGQWRQAALELLAASRCANSAGALAALDSETSGRPAAEQGLFVARYGADVRGAIWAERLESGTTALWGPVLVGSWDRELASVLVATALSHAATLVHALVREDERGLSCALRQAGFRTAGAVGFLLCDRANFPEAPPPLPCALRAITAERSDRVLDVLQQTFEGTLDCPELSMGMNVAQMAALYLAQCDDHSWFVACDQGRDVGCLLTGIDEEETALTLQYVGLVPSVRGRGWGTALTRYALWIAGQRGLPAVELAVDLRNWPAAHMYGELRFEIREQRGLWLHKAQ